MSQGQPGVFLDRDGTLIEDRGYLKHESEVVLFPETIPALTRLQKHFRLFIVTNQSGVLRGEITLRDAETVNAFVTAQLKEAGIDIAAVYCCPHRREDNCACIKPNPLFLKQAEMEFGIDLSRSFSIGDHPHDVELMKSVGGEGVFVLTGHGQRHQSEVNGYTIADNIGQAVEYILGRLRLSQSACLLDGQSQSADNEGGMSTSKTGLRPKTKGQIEAEISEAIIKFEREYMGRGPEEAKTYLIDDLIVVRLRGVLTPAEKQLAKSEGSEQGRTLIKQVRRELLEKSRALLEALIRDITGQSIRSMHTDISTLTGERIIVFSMAGSCPFPVV